MEVLNLIRLFSRWIFPYISRIHTAYISEDSSILGTTSMFGDLAQPQNVQNLRLLGSIVL